MNVNEYIASETERQSGTMAEAAGMGRAYDYLKTTLGAIVEYGWAEDDLINLAYLINGTTGYRLVPAVFNQGPPALPAQQIPRAMNNLVVGINNYGPPFYDAGHWTVEFLLIHPFADGNGRVASLLWNALNRTLDDPKPMPYFFGENNG